MHLRTTIDSLFRKFEKEYVTHNSIEISRSALLHNLDLFSELSGKPAIPVLKGNAYGHGITQVAKALQGRPLPYIAVDGYFEALRIRAVSRQPILIMGAILPENYTRLTYDNFTFVVDSATTVDALAKTGKRVKVHLEANTGMNRYGAPVAEMAELARQVLKHKNLVLEGVMSHLADSDGDDLTTVTDAVGQFDACVEAVRAAGGKPEILHIAQSAGSLRAHSRYANAFRLGLGLYGLNPFPIGHSQYSRLKDMRPALKLVSTITKVISLKEGERVSYNYTFTAPHDMKIGILPLGYYEGINRSLSNKGVVLVKGKPAPIVGRICMNHTMISLDGISAQAGDHVTVYSDMPTDPNSIDNIGRQHGLFNYAVLTGLSPDVRRTLIA